MDFRHIDKRGFACLLTMEDIEDYISPDNPDYEEGLEELVAEACKRAASLSYEFTLEEGEHDLSAEIYAVDDLALLVVVKNKYIEKPDNDISDDDEHDEDDIEDETEEEEELDRFNDESSLAALNKLFSVLGQLAEEKRKEKDKEETTGGEIPLAIKFKNIRDVMKAAPKVGHLISKYVEDKDNIHSSLVKYKGKYYLLIHTIYKNIPYDVTEFGDASVDDWEYAHIEEYGDMIIPQNAIERLGAM